MKKIYQKTRTEIVRVYSMGIMIPTSDPSDPRFLPNGHFVPGPGPSYDPQGSIV